MHFDCDQQIIVNFHAPKVQQALNLTPFKDPQLLKLPPNALEQFMQLYCAENNVRLQNAIEDQQNILDHYRKRMKCSICYEAIVQWRECGYHGCQIRFCRDCMIQMKQSQYQCPSFLFKYQKFYGSNKCYLYITRPCYNDIFEKLTRYSDPLLKYFHDNAYIECQNDGCHELIINQESLPES